MSVLTPKYDELINKLINQPGVLSEEEHLLLDSSDDQIQKLYQLANIFLGKENYSDAEKVLEFLTCEINEAELFAALALSKKKLNKFEEAITNYTKAFKLDPLSCKINYNYGILLYELNKYDKAVEHFLKCKMQS